MTGTTAGTLMRMTVTRKAAEEDMGGRALMKMKITRTTTAGAAAMLRPVGKMTVMMTGAEAPHAAAAIIQAVMKKMIMMTTTAVTAAADGMTTIMITGTGITTMTATAEARAAAQEAEELPAAVKKDGIQEAGTMNLLSGEEAPTAAAGAAEGGVMEAHREGAAVAAHPVQDAAGEPASAGLQP
jgi:hypothetical protein